MNDLTGAILFGILGGAARLVVDLIKSWQLKRKNRP